MIFIGSIVVIWLGLGVIAVRLMDTKYLEGLGYPLVEGADAHGYVMDFLACSVIWLIIFNKFLSKRDRLRREGKWMGQ